MVDKRDLRFTDQAGRPVRVAFYAPIKPPDHPIASGDRLIARNLIKALRLCGDEVELASRFIAYSKRPDGAILEARKADALEEAARVVSGLEDFNPDVFLTYHPYCKAPDWIGPIVSQRLSIPYITVEAARTGQGFDNGQNLWRAWREEAQKGLLKADHHIALKPADRDYLLGLGVSDRGLSMLRPFIDLHSLNPSALPATWSEDWSLEGPVLAAVGMMRPGKKLTNYQLLADALKPLAEDPWALVLVGDGPARPDVEEAFSGFDSARLLFTGALDHSQVLAVMQRSDCLVWPGWKEPIGMVFLEAQAMGTPICALNSMGVPLTVHHGKTGLLAEEETAESLSGILETMVRSAALRKELAAQTQPHIAHNHSLESASHDLAMIVRQCMHR